PSCSRAAWLDRRFTGRGRPGGHFCANRRPVARRRAGDLPPLRVAAGCRDAGAGRATVRVLQVMGYGDVIPNDYFVLEIAGEDALAVTGPFFASALEALARAAGIA